MIYKDTTILKVQACTLSECDLFKLIFMHQSYLTFTQTNSSLLESGFFFFMTKTPLIWQLALLGRDIVGSFKALMRPKSFSTTSPKAVSLQPGHCSLPRWQLGVWQCYEELQLLISELLQCWWQRCKLILKLTEGTWRGPSAYLRKRGQGKNYQRSWVRSTFRKLCL